MRARFTRRTGSLAAAAVLAAVGASPVIVDRLDAAPKPAAQVAAAGLPEQLDALMADPRYAGGKAGLVVRNASTGAVVYSRNGNQRFTPASNEKLLTSAAAVEVLGLDYRFRTTVSAAGNRAGTQLTGNLYLKGTGDPTIQAAGFDALAAQVAAAGIKSVRGAVVADDSWFDSARIGSEWAATDEQFSYAAQISALTVAATNDLDTGIVQLAVRPAAAAGDPASVALTPATTYVKIVNNVTTGAAGSGEVLSVDRVHGQNTIVLTGSLPAGGATQTRLRTVEEPSLYAASMLRAALMKRGVTVSSTSTPRGVTPAGATQVASRDSITLRELLPLFLKLSNNGHAEILTKAMGRKVSNAGTWPAGLAAATTFLRNSGVDTANLRMSDGAGLSRLDLVTPDQVTVLLRAVQSKPWFATWYAALPIAGNPDRIAGGTLTNRMRGTAAAENLRGKTGSMTSVSALSGYVTAADGQKLVFSLLSNDWLASSVKPLEDSIAVTLANSGGATATLKRDLARLPAQRQPKNDPSTLVDERTLECSWVKAC